MKGTKDRVLKNMLDSLEEVYKTNPDVIARIEQKDCVLKTVDKLVCLRDKVVLDAGCGWGRYALRMSRKAKLVYAVDYSKVMLRILRRKIREKGIRNIKVVNADYGKIKLPPNSVDLIISSLSFPGHSHDWDGDLRRFRRMLRPGGSIVVVECLMEGEWWEIRKILGTTRTLLRETISWLRKNGFRMVAKEDSIIDYRNRKNILLAVKPFYGGEFSGYLLGKGQTKIRLRIGIFLWKK